MGYPSVVWQQQMEKAIVITYNNTHLFQKPIPVWDPDYTTTFTTRFRPIPLIDDYNPTYIDPDYGRDPYWDIEIYNQDLLQFQYVLDDIAHYQTTVHENPPITHNKKTKALIENWQMNDGTQNPVFPNPLGTEINEASTEPIPQSLLDGNNSKISSSPKMVNQTVYHFRPVSTLNAKSECCTSRWALGN